MTSVPELSLGAQVLATDGELGTLRALIVDAATGSISHLAVTNGEVPNSARLIALRHVSQADEAGRQTVDADDDATEVVCDRRGRNGDDRALESVRQLVDQTAEGEVGHALDRS
jgi:hypothetical protein